MEDEHCDITDTRTQVLTFMTTDEPDLLGVRFLLLSVVRLGPIGVADDLAQRVEVAKNLRQK